MRGRGIHHVSMTNHDTSVLNLGDGWAARCSCHWAPLSDQHRWQAEDRIAQHLDQVQRVRIHQSTSPSLKQQRDYYLRMADSRDTTPSDRRLWLQLADELSHRLGDYRHSEDQRLL